MPFVSLNDPLGLNMIMLSKLKMVPFTTPFTPFIKFRFSVLRQGLSHHIWSNKFRCTGDRLTACICKHVNRRSLTFHAIRNWNSSVLKSVAYVPGKAYEEDASATGLSADNSCTEWSRVRWLKERTWCAPCNNLSLCLAASKWSFWISSRQIM